MAEELLPLGYVLKERRQANLVTDANVIASYPDGADRTQQANMLIREAMLLRTLGNIDGATQHRVFSILAFAMPEPDAITPNCPTEARGRSSLLI